MDDEWKMRIQKAKPLGKHPSVLPSGYPKLPVYLARPDRGRFDLAFLVTARSSCCGVGIVLMLLLLLVLPSSRLGFFFYLCCDEAETREPETRIKRPKRGKKQEY